MLHYPGLLCAELSVTSGGAPPTSSSWTRCAGWSTAATTRRASRWSTVAHSPCAGVRAGWPTSRKPWRKCRPRRCPVLPAWATPAGPPTVVPPTATRTRTATLPARSPSSTTASSRTSPSCAGSWRLPVSSLPATPIPRSRRTWWRGRIGTARRPMTSSAPYLPCCAGLRGISRSCSPMPTTPAPSWRPAVPRPWCWASATTRCSSVPTWPRLSSTPGKRSSSARTRRW